jgi:Anaphase-promoting complex APC subunit CDC26
MTLMRLTLRDGVWECADPPPLRVVTSRPLRQPRASSNRQRLCGRQRKRPPACTRCALPRMCVSCLRTRRCCTLESTSTPLVMLRRKPTRLELSSEDLKELDRVRQERHAQQQQQQEPVQQQQQQKKTVAERIGLTK